MSLGKDNRFRHASRPGQKKGWKGVFSIQPRRGATSPAEAFHFPLETVWMLNPRGMDPSDKHWGDGVEIFPRSQGPFLAAKDRSCQAESLKAGCQQQSNRHPSACHWDPCLHLSITATAQKESTRFHQNINGSSSPPEPESISPEAALFPAPQHVVLGTLGPALAPRGDFVGIVRHGEERPLQAGQNPREERGDRENAESENARHANLLTPNLGSQVLALHWPGFRHTGQTFLK